MANDKLLQEAYRTIEKLSNQVKGEKNKTEQDRQNLLTAIAKDILRVLQPLLGQIAENSKVNSNEIKRAIESADLKVNVDTKTPEVNVNVPDVIVPDIKVPTPIVNYTPPAINIPKMEMPDEMNIKGWVGLMGVSLESPLPVQLRSADGSPVNLLENLTTLISGGGGGRGIVKVSGFDGSAYSNLQNGDGRLRVSVETGGSGLTDTELRATAVPVSQVSGANWSVSVTDITATNLDIRDLDYTTDDVSVYQVSGASWSVEATISGTPTIQATDLDIRNLNVSQDEVLVHQVSGSMWSTEAYITQGGNVASVDTAGADNESNTSTRLNTRAMLSGFNGTSWDRLRSGGGVEGMALRVTHATDATASTQSKLIARTTNPTATSDATTVFASADDLGRTLTRPIQVRDLIVTAYVSVTNGTEATLLTASAGSFHDLIMLVGSNNSDAAVSVDIRAVTGGNIINTLRIPANGTAGFVPAVPWPQDATGNNWTVDGPDETGRTLTFSALFSREI